MKAIDMLTWLVNQSINVEGMAFLSVTEDFDFESYFGYWPASHVPEGEYMYIYGDQVLAADIDLLTKSARYTPYCIPTTQEDKRNGGMTIIYLFRIDEL